MTEISAVLVSLLGANPSTISLVLVVVFVVYMLWIHSRRVDIEAINTVSKIQSDNIEDLLRQNSELAKELHSVRKQQVELFSMVEEMKKQNLQLQEHIMRLENYVKSYMSICIECPRNAKEVVGPPPKRSFPLPYDTHYHSTGDDHV